MTVMPAPSSASVRSRNVSGESSTTSATSRFLASLIMAVEHLQGCHVLIEVEAVDQRMHLRYEPGMLGMFVADLVQLGLDRANVPHASEIDQLLDILWRWPRACVGLPVG